jgi:Protein of unknown function, DUF547
MRLRVLNPGRADGDPVGEPIELSERILSAAQTMERSDERTRLNGLTVQLRAMDPAAIDGDAARVPFWINLYNALFLQCRWLKPMRGNLLRHLRLFGRFAYEVGHHPYTLNLIEHGVLRGNRRPPLGRRSPLRGNDRRLASVVSHPDPRIHFALNCGARSCPPIRPYHRDELDAQLDASTRGYLELETAVDLEKCEVTLPGLMRLYAADFGDRDEQLAFAAGYLPAVQKCVEASGQAVSVRYSRFDWTVTGGLPS